MILTFLPNVFIVANNCVGTLARPVVVGVEIFECLVKEKMPQEVNEGEPLINRLGGGKEVRRDLHSRTRSRGGW